MARSTRYNFTLLGHLSYGHILETCFFRYYKNSKVFHEESWKQKIKWKWNTCYMKKDKQWYPKTTQINMNPTETRGELMCTWVIIQWYCVLQNCLLSIGNRLISCTIDEVKGYTWGTIISFYFILIIRWINVDKTH